MLCQHEASTTFCDYLPFLQITTAQALTLPDGQPTRSSPSAIMCSMYSLSCRLRHVFDVGEKCTYTAACSVG